MKDLKTYIDKNKFQFITSFEQVEITNTKGENIILDFGSLDIDERIFLSAFLTYVVQNEGISKKLPLVSLYDVVFNFNGNKKNKTSYHQTFIDVIGNFLRSNAHYLAYIIDNYKEIKENKTTIYRTQLNRSEMDLLYSLKFQRSYRTFVNVLYIMGVSKSNARTKKLNKIPLSRFYKDSVSMSKKRAAEIMEKLNIKYQIYEDNVYFSNGFGIDLDEKYYSDEKKQFEKDKFEEQILDSFGLNIEEEEQCKEIFEKVKAEEKVEAEDEDTISYDDSIEEIKEPEDTDDENAWEDFPTEPAEDIDSILDIGEGHFQWETFEKLYNYDKDNRYEIDNEYRKLKEKYKELQGKKLFDLQSKYHLNINDLTRKHENLFRVLKNDYKDVNYGETRDNARIELSNIQAAVCSGLSKLYDDYADDYDFYKYWVFYLMLNHKNVITLKI